MNRKELNRKLLLLSTLTEVTLTDESYEQAWKDFKDKTMDEFMDHLPQFIFEANNARRLLRDKEKKKKLIILK